METNWEGIQQDLMVVIDEVKTSHSKTTSQLSNLTSLVDKTFDLVVELRFKVDLKTKPINPFEIQTFFPSGWY